MCRVAAFAITTTCSAAAGCGTVQNLIIGDQTPYGGVRQRADYIAHGGGDVEDLVGVPLAALDFPLTVAADTATLPFTVPVTLVRLATGGYDGIAPEPRTARDIDPDPLPGYPRFRETGAPPVVVPLAGRVGDEDGKAVPGAGAIGDSEPHGESPRRETP